MRDGHDGAGVAEATRDTGGDPVGRLEAYRLAMTLAREARGDAAVLCEDPAMHELAGQLVRAAGSIGANIAEGYSRGTTADRRKFFEYALGSARECVVWYETAGSVHTPRIATLVSIRRLLITMIRNARGSTAADRRKFQP